MPRDLRGWAVKGAWIFASWLVVGIPYILAQHLSLRPVTWLERSAFDQWIGTNYHATWIYLTYYPLMLLGGLTVAPERVFRRYLIAVCAIGLLSHIVFFIYPTGVSRPDLTDLDLPWIYTFLTALDQPVNAMPSLHASLSALAAWALARFCWQRKLPWAAVLAWIWAFAILWATIATGQHVAIDLITGGVMGVVGAVWYPSVRSLR